MLVANCVLRDAVGDTRIFLSFDDDISDPAPPLTVELHLAEGEAEVTLHQRSRLDWTPRERHASALRLVLEAITTAADSRDAVLRLRQPAPAPGTATTPPAGPPP